MIIFIIKLLEAGSSFSFRHFLSDFPPHGSDVSHGLPPLTQTERFVYFMTLLNLRDDAGRWVPLLTSLYSSDEGASLGTGKHRE